MPNRKSNTSENYKAMKMPFWNVLPSVPAHRPLSNLPDTCDVPQHNCFCCNPSSIDSISLCLVTCPALFFQCCSQEWKFSLYPTKKFTAAVLLLGEGSILYSNVASRMPLNLNTLFSKEPSSCSNQAVHFPRRVSINIKHVNNKQWWKAMYEEKEKCLGDLSRKQLEEGY